MNERTDAPSGTPTSTPTGTPLAVLDFWFTPQGITNAADVSRRWFAKNPEFDREITSRFLALHEEAALGALQSWQGNADGCLGLILLLDQFPRNMFRDTPRAFATDAQARDVARLAVRQGFDHALEPQRRSFLYLPFEHSEDLADQETALRLMGALPGSDQPKSVYHWAKAHHAIIARFGRFPHRNAILGRQSTAEEAEFLTRPEVHF